MKAFSYKIGAVDKLSVFKILADIFAQPCRRDRSVSSKRFCKPQIRVCHRRTYYIDISTPTCLPFISGGGSDEAITTCIFVKILYRPLDNFPAMFVGTQLNQKYLLMGRQPICSRVLSKKNRYSKPKHDLFPFSLYEVFFGPTPNQIINAALWQERNWKFNQKKT